MSPRSLVALPIFVFSLLLCADTHQRALCIALSNVFGYVWISLIWHAERGRLVWYYLLFVGAVGPFTYFRDDPQRDFMISLGYSALWYHLYQPLAALTVPAVSFAVRFRRRTPERMIEPFFFRSAFEILIGVPALTFLMAMTS
ncbi:hypothetical protein [Alienimonas chondri]|uniref:Uncharacterized protein n=1 Tax=Alienimonas chondri TaxID=2681879 RepID=A0ABX1VH57_9PLAN|nr:hypothetical protein [Alienimonas chondri]NNJ27463.1 hypothetical protein [Alienimonas chondri]